MSAPPMLMDAGSPGPTAVERRCGGGFAVRALGEDADLLGDIVVGVERVGEDTRVGDETGAVVDGGACASRVAMPGDTARTESVGAGLSADHARGTATATAQPTTMAPIEAMIAVLRCTPSAVPS
ncbi:MAG: hypothetical protein ABI345_09465 [Jatrophihabitans sp.]